MIKKVEITTNTEPQTKLEKAILLVFNGVAMKLNEIIDAVNKLETMAKNTNTVLKSLVEENNIHEKQIGDLQNRITTLDDPTYHKAEPDPADPYTEQRKWIGKLCRFWDDDAFVTSNDWAFGILTSIDKGMQYQYCCNNNCNFKHCEPVKPDDDIIYKEERDENI